jgi:hypothetical protein
MFNIFKKKKCVPDEVIEFKKELDKIVKDQQDAIENFKKCAETLKQLSNKEIEA